MTNPSAPRRPTFVRRLVGAARLDVAIFEDVEADRGATAQAVAVVLLSSMAAGVGARGFGGINSVGIAFFSTVALTAWAAWAMVTCQIGVRLLPEAQTRADFGQLLRTTGFATAPGLLRVAGVIPDLTVPVFAISAVWMLLAMIVAVRQALDFRSTGRAVAVCGLGWILALAFAIVLGFFFGPRVS